MSIRIMVNLWQRSRPADDATKVQRVQMPRRDAHQRRAITRSRNQVKSQIGQKMMAVDIGTLAVTHTLTEAIVTIAFAGVDSTATSSPRIRRIATEPRLRRGP